MNTNTQDRIVFFRITQHVGGKCPEVTAETARTLRRAALTLHRWAERECGDGSGTWIERDEVTGRPFEVRHQGDGYLRRPIPDREAGALRRVAVACEAAGLHWFHQGDPRGVSLYVAAVPLDGSNYSRDGVAIY